MTQENKILLLARKGYELLIGAGSLMQHIFLLAFRLSWGVQFYQSGAGKLKNHADIVSFFTDLGIPLPDLNAWVVAGVECVGGILLLAGLASRPVGLVLTVTMTVAYLSVADDRAKVFNMFKDPDAFLQADPFFFLLTALLVFCFGPGKISVDYLLGRFLFNKNDSTTKEQTEETT